MQGTGAAYVNRCPGRAAIYAEYDIFSSVARRLRAVRLPLRRVFCAEADAELRELCLGKTRTRAEENELGDLIALVRLVCANGPEHLEGGPSRPCGRAVLYVIHRRHFVMWLAVCDAGAQAAAVKWMPVSTDVMAQQEAAAEAAERARRLFPA